ncbi:MAG: hypothetical protein Q9222_003236 [Ikaeria aurantiellina]
MPSIPGVLFMTTIPQPIWNRGIENTDINFSVLSSTSLALNDQHELDYSPTPTPVQTRAVSPYRGSNDARGHREAIEMMFQLNQMVAMKDTTEARDAHQPLENDDAANEISAEHIASKRVHTLRRHPQASVTSDSSIVSQLGMEKKVQVSAIDGTASIPAAAKIQILLVYFAFNLGLTLYNKAVMIKVNLEATLSI